MPSAACFPKRILLVAEASALRMGKGERRAHRRDPDGPPVELGDLRVALGAYRASGARSSGGAEPGHSCHARGRASEREPSSEGEDHLPPRGCPAGTRSGGPGVRGHRAGPALGCRNHLRADDRRPFLPPGGVGRLESPGRHLVDGPAPEDRARPRCLGGSSLPAAAGRRHPPLGPGAPSTPSSPSTSGAARPMSGAP